MPKVTTKENNSSMNNLSNKHTTPNLTYEWILSSESIIDDLSNIYVYELLKISLA